MTVTMVHESRFVSPFHSKVVSSPSLRQFQVSGHGVLLRRNSSSLTVVFVTMQEGVRFTTSQLHHMCSCKSWLSWSVAVCVHVHGLWECTNFDQALCTQDTFEVSCDARRLHLVALSGTKDLSCCFVHAVNDVSTLLAHVQQLSHAVLYTAHFSFSSSTSDSVVVVLLMLGVLQVSSFPDQARPSRLGSTSDLPLPSIHMPFSRSLCLF